MPNAHAGLVPRFSIAEAISQDIREAARSGEIQYVVITRADGLLIGHNFPEQNVARRLAAMSAAIVGTATVVATELAQGAFREVSIDADRGRVACLQAGDQAIVAALVPTEARLGSVLPTLRRLATQVRDAIARWESGDLDAHEASPAPRGGDGSG